MATNLRELIKAKGPEPHLRLFSRFVGIMNGFMEKRSNQNDLKSCAACLRLLVVPTFEGNSKRHRNWLNPVIYHQKRCVHCSSSKLPITGCLLQPNWQTSPKRHGSCQIFLRGEVQQLQLYTYSRWKPSSSVLPMKCCPSRKT